ncbi:PAK4-inhibitor INKA2 isoform X1 [Pseudochaenichthys georgianus]|uniref:PAK4-inhibitor INKA2 isoform X1 n=2 Tax=Pseudochaenichthys georgianus TaxID=52239 RepID=UPI00146F130D|nr:PAK4-inhibitor INKA2 isoform X1 [Pseudochaenichthys georgianus]
MEPSLSKQECKTMDSCLRRLKQELLCMKEAGDGLHEQMNSMMGALQELKLLQVQTALENLDISGRPINRGLQHSASPEASATATSTSGKDCGRCFGQTTPEESSMSPMPSPSMGSRNTFSRDDRSLSRIRSSLGTSSSSASSLESETEGSELRARNVRSENDLESIPKRWSGYSAPQVDFYGPMVGNPPPEPYAQPQAPPRAQAVDLPGILYSLSREGPSLDSEYSQDSTEDASDWTSSLMSRSRNRQPLVLGDNVFADLVGNWLDLPEVEREEGEEEERRKIREADGAVDRPDTPAHPLRLSRSQEICRKFSFTTNIFKKFLRSVRPDRDKLLKERPGWMAPELSEGDLFKRPKKVAPKSSKGSFYLPFWANGKQGKGRPCHLAEAERDHQHHFSQVHQQPFAGIYLDKRQPETGLEKMQPLFDYNTAVWV